MTRTFKAIREAAAGNSRSPQALDILSESLNDTHSETEVKRRCFRDPTDEWVRIGSTAIVRSILEHASVETASAYAEPARSNDISSRARCRSGEGRGFDAPPPLWPKALEHSESEYRALPSLRAQKLVVALSIRAQDPGWSPKPVIASRIVQIDKRLREAGHD